MYMDFAFYIHVKYKELIINKILINEFNTACLVTQCVHYYCYCISFFISYVFFFFFVFYICYSNAATIKVSGGGGGGRVQPQYLDLP